MRLGDETARVPHQFGQTSTAVVQCNRCDVMLPRHVLDALPPNSEPCRNPFLSTPLRTQCSDNSKMSSAVDVAPRHVALYEMRVGLASSGGTGSGLCSRWHSLLEMRRWLCTWLKLARDQRINIVDKSIGAGSPSDATDISGMNVSGSNRS
jgi:hypothetical protein